MEHFDKGLLVQIAEGDAAAFSEFFHSYRDKLYSFILGICKSPQQSQDIVQDIFLKIWLMRSELSRIRDIDQYLFRMAHNHCINILKRNANELLARSESNLYAPVNLIEEEVEFRETQAFVYRSIEDLPRQQKEVFILSREKGLSQEQISRQLNIAVPTVKAHMTQALRFLRSRCKNLYPIIKSIPIFILASLSS